jgi:hypothetical protein
MCAVATPETGTDQTSLGQLLFMRPPSASARLLLPMVLVRGARKLSTHTRRGPNEHDLLRKQGVDLGPLQGIPYGLKDLMAVEGYRTTWGAPAYMDQVLAGSSNVYKRCARCLR